MTTAQTRSGARGDAPTDDSTRTKILEAALDCLMQLGIAKTSLHDVARAADVSRGTVYRYFSERQSLIDATIEWRAQRYYTEAAGRMAACDTLGAQIGAFAEVVARNVADFSRHRLVHGDSTLMRLSASDPDGALRRMSHFLIPYLDSAKERGEISSGLNSKEASEWIVRVLMSLTTMQGSSAFDIRKPASVRRFFERYAVRGLS